MIADALAVTCPLCTSAPGDPCRTVRPVAATSYRPSLPATGRTTTRHYARYTRAVAVKFAPVEHRIRP